MGMAASQARYLALVARKSNCEYEGQQINQARLALSNQSADLWNQMMGLEVPTTPSKSDFTYTTYTFNDGSHDITIDKWSQLSDSQGEGYNYAVTYHYDSKQNTGYQKYKYDPQVRFSGVPPTKDMDPELEVANINAALANIELLENAMNVAYSNYSKALTNASLQSNYNDNLSVKQAHATYDEASKSYNVTDEAGTVFTYIPYASIEDEALKTQIDTCLKAMISYHTFNSEDLGVSDNDYTKVYYNADTDTITLYKNLSPITIKDAKADLTGYHVSDVTKVPERDPKIYTMQEMIDEVTPLEDAYKNAKLAYDQAFKGLTEEYSIPVEIGTIKLKALGKAGITEEVQAAITEIMNQMEEDEIVTNLKKCFSTIDGTYDSTTYLGGLYSFTQANQTCYVTYYDLFNSIVNGSGINNIDDQKKLPYYGTEDIKKPVENTSRALIEKDKSGRFKTIRLEDDSVVYDLKAVTETDEIAYEDAVNEATYQKYLYDKKVQDINLKTSLIQRQDQQLELRLKQLDTEQNALATEIDAVAKVVKDNIEKSFKTFGG